MLFQVSLRKYVIPSLESLVQFNCAPLYELISFGFTQTVLLSQSFTYPVEVVRRRMQTIGIVGNDTAFSSIPGAGSASKSCTKPPTVLETARTVFAEQGIRGFYKGVSMNWIKGPVAFSISFTTFDIVQGMMASDAERAARIPR